MTLITQEYREQNQRLHSERPDYGSTGDKWAPEVSAAAMQLMDELGRPPVILDYGCGKGSLKVALPEFEVREYDPAIPEKSENPAPADITVCTDVLEHVEPELLDYVLMHLQNRTERLLIFSIATAYADKQLDDGRNAHLIVQPAGFWLTHLANYFVVESMMLTETHISGTAKPLYLLQIPEAKPAVGHEVRNQQAEANCARVSRRIVADGDERVKLPDNGRKAHLLAGGPSMRDTWSECMVDRDADVFTCSVAHKMMQEQEAIWRVKAHMDADPREHKARQIGDVDARIEYWLASCIHPSFIDKCEAAGATIKLWHAYNGQASVETLGLPSERGQRMIMGGGSIGLRALSLLYYLGYHHIIIHGMDCSYGSDMADHAAEHLGKKPDPVSIYHSGRQFWTTPALITYAKYFVKQMQWMPDALVELRGDGLLRSMHG